jgi:tetratricopeptide (TPR) repeat protein
MIKQNLLKIILFTCSFMIIASIIVFYIFPKNQSSHLTVPKDQLTSPDKNPDPAFSSSATIEKTTKTIHVSDAQALANYDQGLKLYYQRQFPEALQLFNQALAIDTLCYEALNAKGATLAFQGKYDQGLALIQQALDLNPSFVYANFNQGLAYELAGRWDQAISSYHKALQLDNRDTWSYYGIASVYGRQGKIEKVLEYLQPAISLDPDVKEVARNEHDFLPVREDPRSKPLSNPSELTLVVSLSVPRALQKPEVHPVPEQEFPYQPLLFLTAQLDNPNFPHLGTLNNDLQMIDLHQESREQKQLLQRNLSHIYIRKMHYRSVGYEPIPEQFPDQGPLQIRNKLHLGHDRFRRGYLPSRHHRLQPQSEFSSQIQQTWFA